MNNKTNKVGKAALVAMIGLASVSTLKASSSYDLIAGFTQQGANSSGNDLMIDIGPAVPVSGYSTGFSDGETWNLSSLLSSQNFNLSQIKWGVVGDASTIDNDGANMLWVTTSGLAPSTLSGTSAFNQAVNTPITAMETEFNPSGPSSTNQTATPVASGSNPDPNSWNQQTIVGSSRSALVNSYGGIAVNAAGATSVPLWQVAGDGSAPTKLGTFTLSASGILTFNVTSTALSPPPRIVSATRVGNTSTINFTTTNGFTYTLYYTNSSGLTAPVTNWASSVTTISGNGLTNSLADTTTATNRFYRIGVH